MKLDEIIRTRQEESRKRRDLVSIIFERENGKCFYCDVAVSMSARMFLSRDPAMARKLNAATLDHLIPRSRRGVDTPENTVCACAGCNWDRADRPAIDFLYERRARQ